MADNDKTLSQTIRQVMGEPTQAASDQTQSQTGKELSVATATGEPKSGVTPEYVNGVDISTFPEQERPIARKVLEEKGKLLEKGYQPKFAEIAEFKKQREALLSLGINENQAVDIIREHIASKTNAKDAKKEVSRVIDQLKDSAPDLETKKGLENLENIIKELTNIDEIKKELADLKGYVNHSRGREFQTREQSLGAAMDALVGDYGQEFIDKYRENVVREGLKYVDADPEQLLGAIANPKELKQAILSNSTKKEDTRKQEKINAVSSPGSGMTSPTAVLDTKKMSMKDIFRQIAKK